MPDLEQDAIWILPPLVIAKSQFLDIVSRKPLSALLVMLVNFWRPVLEAIQLNGKPGEWAVKIQKIPSGGMLPTEFETGKSSGAKRKPELLFFAGLLPAQPAGDMFWFQLAQTIAMACGNQSNPSP